jgi:ParB family transcriptional regulator, chromosome partitioning protein
MKRKELVSALLKTTPAAETNDVQETKPSRVAAGSVRAMGLELDHLTQQADQAALLREQIAGGSAVVQLDPDQVEPSFISDRLAPTQDLSYRQLVESIRKDEQKIPILVRPHPGKRDMYQIAYGRRRWHAAQELSIKVRAIVQNLTDQELVIAQGKENSERRNLSFIERALFAANLEAGGFDRATINSALAVQTAETSRLLAVAASIPAHIVNSLGPAPKAGRTRWLELGELLQNKDILQIALKTLRDESVAKLGSDAKFEALIAALRAAASSPNAAEVIRNVRGEPVIRILRSGRNLKLSVDDRFAQGFGTFLIRSLPKLLKEYDKNSDDPRDIE